MCYLYKAVTCFFLFALAGCATLAGSAGRDEVFVMRHLQAGTGEDPALSEVGRGQAQLLAGWFTRSQRPRAIYVTRFRRSQETAAPLAAKLRVKPIVYDPSDNEALVQAVKAQRGNILIVGHSNTVPDIVERLGGTRPEPIQHHQHGEIWRVSGSGETEKLQLGRR